MYTWEELEYEARILNAQESDVEYCVESVNGSPVIASYARDTGEYLCLHEPNNLSW